MKIFKLNEGLYSNEFKDYVEKQLFPELKKHGIDFKAKIHQTRTQLDYIGEIGTEADNIEIEFSSSSKFIEQGQGEIFARIVLDASTRSVGTLSGKVEEDVDMIIVCIIEDFEYDLYKEGDNNV